MQNRNVIVDADAIIATIHKTDSNHNTAITIRNKLHENGYNLIYPSTSIAESITVVQGFFNDKELVNKLAKLFAENSEYIHNIDGQIVTSAIKNYFVKTNSKKNTLFDCIIAQCADNINTKYIFSFDSYYKSIGFTIGEDLL